MKAWSKRVIWFFGTWLLNLFDELSYYYRTGSNVGIESGLIYLAIMIIPLFFFKDDGDGY